MILKPNLRVHCIKDAKVIISEHRSKLFNICLLGGVYPHDIKASEIVQIFKKAVVDLLPTIALYRCSPMLIKFLKKYCITDETLTLKNTSC